MGFFDFLKPSEPKKKVKTKRMNNLLPRRSFWMSGLGGALCILFSVIINLAIEPWDSGTARTAWEHASTFANSIGQALVAAGVISYFLELPEFSKKIEAALLKILTKKDYLKVQNRSGLMKLRKDVTEQYYKVAGSHYDKTLVEFDQRLIEHFAQPYFEYFKETIVCKVKPGENGSTYIEKDCTLKFKLNNSDSSQIRNLLDYLNVVLYFEPMDDQGVKDDSIREIVNFRVTVDDQDTKDIEQKLLKITTNRVRTDGDKFTLRTQLPKDEEQLQDVLKFKHTISGVVKEKRIVPMSDSSYSLRLNLLTKKLSIDYIFRSEDHELLAECFGSLTDYGDPDCSIELLGGSAHIDCEKWMMKGNGFYIVSVPKPKLKQC